MSTPPFKLKNLDQVRPATEMEIGSIPEFTAGVLIPAGDEILRLRFSQTYPRTPVFFNEESLSTTPSLIGTYFSKCFSVVSNGVSRMYDGTTSFAGLCYRTALKRFALCFSGTLFVSGAWLFYHPSLCVTNFYADLIPPFLVTTAVGVLSAHLAGSSIPLVPRYTSFGLLCSGFVVFVSSEGVLGDFCAVTLFGTRLVIIFYHTATSANLENWKVYLGKLREFMIAFKDIAIVCALAPPMICTMLGGLKELVREGVRMLKRLKED